MRPESLAPLSNSHRPTLAALDAVTNHRGQDLRERISFSQPLTNSLSSQTRLVSTLGKTSCQGDGVAYRRRVVLRILAAAFDTLKRPAGDSLRRHS